MRGAHGFAGGANIFECARESVMKTSEIKFDSRREEQKRQEREFFGLDG